MMKCLTVYLIVVNYDYFSLYSVLLVCVALFFIVKVSRKGLDMNPISNPYPLVSCPWS